MKPKLKEYTFRDTDLFYSGYLECLIEEEDYDTQLKDFVVSLLKKTVKDEDIYRGLINLIRASEQTTDIDLSEIGMDIFIDSVLHQFLEKDPRYEEMVNLNARKYNLSRKAILAAHGDSKDTKWCYEDETNLFLVQDWIDSKDGEYAALILNSCNPGSHEVSSRKSAVLVPNEVYSPARQNMGEVKVELYIPGNGYIDSYTIDRELGDMKESL